MWRAFGAAGRGIRQVFGHTGLLLLGNAASIALSLPIIVLVGVSAYVVNSFSVIPLGIVIFVAVLPNPAVAGLQSMLRDLAVGDVLQFEEFKRGLRRYGPQAARMWGISTAITIVLLANIGFYGTRPVGAISTFVQGFWVYLLLAWLAVHVYVYPLLFVQKNPRFLSVYRNAVVLAISQPGYTLLVSSLWLVVLLLAGTTGLSVLIGLAFGGAIQQNALVRALERSKTPAAA